MTVCIAARCFWGGQPIIIGASDRMITAFDEIEYEPPQSKIIPLTSSIVAMYSGDSAIQATVCNRTLADIRDRLSPDSDWTSVEEAANVVGSQVARCKREIIERTLLEPFGLDLATFIEKQPFMSPEWLASMTRQIADYELEIDMIVTGVDNHGAHIYLVDGFGEVTCADTADFAAIGGGGHHAESQFMFAGHAYRKTWAETMLLTYTAKKYAEIAPGVGKDTDMFTIFGLGGYDPEGAMIQAIDKLYQSTKEKQHAATLRASETFRKGFERAAKRTVTAGDTKATEERSSATQLDIGSDKSH